MNKEGVVMAADKKSAFLSIDATEQFLVESAKVGFALELKLAMDRAGVTNAQLAELLQVSRPMITKLLRGDANATIETMVKAANALGSKLFLRIIKNGSSAQLFEIARTAMAKPRAHAVQEAFRRPVCAWADQNWTYSANDLDETEDEIQPLAA